MSPSQRIRAWRTPVGSTILDRSALKGYILDGVSTVSGDIPSAPSSTKFLTVAASAFCVHTKSKYLKKTCNWYQFTVRVGVMNRVRNTVSKFFLRLTDGSQGCPERGRERGKGGYVLYPTATGYPVPACVVAAAAASNKAGQK